MEIDMRELVVEDKRIHQDKIDGNSLFNLFPDQVGNMKYAADIAIPHGVKNTRRAQNPKK